MNADDLIDDEDLDTAAPPVDAAPAKRVAKSSSVAGILSALSTSNVEVAAHINLNLNLIKVQV